MSMDDELEEYSEDQSGSSRADHLKPWQYKKGQSGNPGGRPPGISLKEYARIKFRTMTDEEREEFFNGMDKRTLWEMGEGKPDAKTEVDTTVTINTIDEEEKAKLLSLLNDQGGTH